MTQDAGKEIPHGQVDATETSPPQDPEKIVRTAQELEGDKVQAEIDKLNAERDKLLAEKLDIESLFTKSFWRTVITAALTLIIAAGTLVLGFCQVAINQGELDLKKEVAKKPAGEITYKLETSSPLLATDTRSPPNTAPATEGDVHRVSIEGLDKPINFVLSQQPANAGNNVPQPANNGAKVQQSPNSGIDISLPAGTPAASVDNFGSKLLKARRILKDDFSNALQKYLESLGNAPGMTATARIASYPDLLRSMYAIYPDPFWKQAMLKTFTEDLCYAHIPAVPKSDVNENLRTVIEKSLHLLDLTELRAFTAVVSELPCKTKLDELQKLIDEEMRRTPR